MNRLFENMNIKQLKIVLGLFIICGGGYSIYLLVTAITKQVKTNLKIEQLDVPKYFNRTGDETVTQEAFVDDETYLNIQAFRKYMDSLKQTKSKMYDSILLTRPGLLDSVQMLEEIYRSQKQK